jgi:heptosyltransferase I
VESNIDSLTPDSICVIRLSALGDCCHALPVVRTLRDNFPDTKLTWIVGKTEYQLLEGIEDIEFIIFDKSNLLKSLIKLSGELKHRKFDILLHMHASMTANLVSCLVKATRKIGFDKDRARDLQRLFCNEMIASNPQQHVMDGLLEFSKYIGVVQQRLRWNLPISKSSSENANQQIDGGKITCVISPCSSQRYGDAFNKNWSVDNYIKVIDHLITKYNIQVILTGGKTTIETRYSEQLIGYFQNRITNLIGKTSINNLVAIINKADFILCPDSGPAHISTATNTPVIGLYAVTNPLRVGPYYSQKWVINAYPEAVKKFLHKDIGEVKWSQKIKQPEAMNLITAKEVQEKIDQFILMEIEKK